MREVTIPSGSGIAFSGLSFNASPMKSIQIGNASWFPCSPMDCDLSKPTQAAVTKSPLKPQNQPSF